MKRKGIKKQGKGRKLRCLSLAKGKVYPSSSMIGILLLCLPLNASLKQRVKQAPGCFKWLPVIWASQVLCYFPAENSSAANIVKPWLCCYRLGEKWAWDDFLLECYFSYILENILWQAWKRKLRQMRKKGKFKKLFLLWRTWWGREWRRTGICTTCRAWLHSFVFLLSLTSKETMMLQAVLWSLDIPCWPKEAQGTTAVSKGRVCCLNWNKRVGIILLSLWSAIVSMPLQFWATAFHTLESHNIIYYPWLGNNLLLFWRFFPFTVLSFLSQGIEESEFLLLIFAILPAKFNLMCVWVKDRLVVTL